MRELRKMKAAALPKDDELGLLPPEEKVIFPFVRLKAVNATSQLFSYPIYASLCPRESDSLPFSYRIRSLEKGTNHWQRAKYCLLHAI